MDITKDLEEINGNLKKLRDSIYENDIFDNATDKQEEAFHKMLSALIIKTELYITKFNEQEHVIQMHQDLEELQKDINSEDINFYINTMKERLDWYYENEKKENDGNFIAASDMVILWPLRAIAEKMYRNLLNKPFDERFDKFFK